MVQKSEKLKNHRMAILNSAVVVAIITGTVAVLQTVIRSDRKPEEVVIDDWNVLRSHRLFFTIRERRIVRDAHQCSSGDSLSTRLARTIDNISHGTVVDMFVEMISDMEARPVAGELWRTYALRSLMRQIEEYIQLVQEIPAIPTGVLRWFMESRAQATLRRSRAIEDITIAGRSAYELTEIWLDWFTRLYRERVRNGGAWWCTNIDSAMVGGRPIL